MASITFALPKWPNVVDDNALRTHHKIILWIYCLLFIVILPFIIVYYFYGLRKLRYLVAIRQRYLNLLTFFFVVILIELIIIEPIRLLFATYLSSLDVFYWIYLILSTFCTQFIVYTVLLKVWLLFYDIKWNQVCIINDNQWRYHINNPLQDEQIKQNKETGKIEEEQAHHIEHFNNDRAKSDISWFVKHRQSFGNINYIYKYCLLVAVLSVIISLASTCLLDDESADLVYYIALLLPIIMICLLWMNTPTFNDIFLLRKEMKLLFIYAICCVIIYTIIYVLLLYDDDQDIELQLVLILIYHLMMFGIFMFLVYCPIKHILPFYSERIKSNLIESQRTTSILDDDIDQNVNIYCCICCISHRFLNRVALFNDSVLGFNESLSSKRSLSLKKLQMVTSSSQNTINANAHQIEVALKKEKKIKNDDYKFNNVNMEDDDEDEDEDSSLDVNYDKREKERLGIASQMSLKEGENGSMIQFVPIKSPKTNHIKLEIDRETEENAFKLLETEEGLNLFMNYCAKEYALNNVFALIELNQFEIYVKKQEKYTFELREIRMRSAKQRTLRKRQSILRAKERKNQEIQSKKEELKAYNNNNNNVVIDIGSRRRSSRKRRKQRIKQNKKEHNILDDDDLILDEIANKTPIDTVIHTSFDIDSMDDLKDEINEFESGGNEGDDEDEEEDECFVTNNKLRININEQIHNLPESSIIFNHAFVCSKNKRIQQMQEIVIALAQKYVLSKSVFQLNLATEIVNEIEDKIDEWRNKEKKKKANRARGGSNYSLNNLTDDELIELSISDVPPQAIQLELNYSGSNYSLTSPYSQNHEAQLQSFFDPIIDSTANCIIDSFYRWKQTKEYKQFIENHK